MPEEPKMSAIPCPVCDASDQVELYPKSIGDNENVQCNYSFSPEASKTYRIVRCRVCSHAFASPMPEEIAHNYVSVVDEEYLRHQRPRELTADAVIGVIRREAPAGRLLDVGCATGDFPVRAAAAGYSAEGLEVSRWSAKAARDRGIAVHEQFLEAFAPTHAAQYDVVTLWGVIEHLARPAVEIAHVAKVLKPGGLLALWTGDVDSLSSRLFGRKWWWCQGQHIQYFTHASLIRLFEKSGFEHVRTLRYPVAMTYEMFSNSLRRYPSLRPLILALVWPLFQVMPVVYLRLPGEMLALFRRKG